MNLVLLSSVYAILLVNKLPNFRNQSTFQRRKLGNVFVFLMHSLVLKQKLALKKE